MLSCLSMTKCACRVGACPVGCGRPGPVFGRDSLCCTGIIGMLGRHINKGTVILLSNVVVSDALHSHFLQILTASQTPIYCPS